jgi:hypothetical protein
MKTVFMYIYINITLNEMKRNRMRDKLCVFFSFFYSSLAIINLRWKVLAKKKKKKKKATTTTRSYSSFQFSPIMINSLFEGKAVCFFQSFFYILFF